MVLNKIAVNFILILFNVDFNFFVANYIGVARPQAKLTFILIQLPVTTATIFHS